MQLFPEYSYCEKDYILRIAVVNYSSLPMIPTFLSEKNGINQQIG